MTVIKKKKFSKMDKLPVENMISLCNCNSSWLEAERGLEVVPLACESLPQASLLLETWMQPYLPSVFFFLEMNEIDDGDDEDKNHGSNCSHF